MTSVIRVLASLLLVAGLVVEAAAAERAPVGRVARQTGPVTVVRGSTAAPLILGAPVYEADLIQTGPGARLSIAFEDGSTLVMAEQCRVSIARYDLNPDGSRLSALLSLITGLLRATVTRAEDPFAVRTETAIASARSTDWTVETTADGTAVFVVEGAVGVEGRRAGGAVVLEPGFGTDVRLGQPPTPPVRWGAPRVERTLSRLALPPP